MEFEEVIFLGKGVVAAVVFFGGLKWFVWGIENYQERKARTRRARGDDVESGTWLYRYDQGKWIFPSIRDWLPQRENPKRKRR